MKLIFKVSILLFSILASASAQKGYKISVKMEGGPENKPLYLAHFFGYNQYIKVDSTMKEDGMFYFQGEEDLKGGIYLLVENPSKYYDFLISGDEKDIYMEFDTTNYIESVEVQGSKENEILFSYRKLVESKSKEASLIQKQIQSVEDPKVKAEMQGEILKIKEQVNSFMKNLVMEHDGTLAAKVINANIEPQIPKVIPVNSDGTKDSTFAYRYYKNHFWDNLDLSDERLLNTPFIQSKLEKYFKDLVYQKQDSIIKDADYVLNLSKKNSEVYRYFLWNITNKYENTDVVGLDGVFVHLAENYYLKDASWLDTTQLAKFEKRVKVLKPLLTGKVFPQLVLADTTGKQVNINDSKAKYTIVYFYSPDCGHCKDSAPKLMEYYQKNKAQVNIYNIAIKYDLAEIKEFIKKYKTGSVYNLWDQKARYSFIDDFDVYSTPTSYILNEKLEIIGKRIPIEEFSKFIEFYENQSSSKSR